MSDSLAEHDAPARPAPEPSVVCTRCGYSLQGLATTGACPECALPIATSIRLSSLRYADPEHLRTLRRGSILAAIGASLISLAVLVLIGSIAAELVASMRQSNALGHAMNAPPATQVTQTSNADGSITQTIARADGSVTEITTYPDGRTVTQSVRQATITGTHGPSARFQWVLNITTLAWLLVTIVLVPLGWWWLTARNPVRRGAERLLTARRIARWGAVAVPILFAAQVGGAILGGSGVLLPIGPGGSSALSALMVLIMIVAGVLAWAAQASLYFGGLLHIRNLGRQLQDQAIVRRARLMLWAPLVLIAAPVIGGCALGVLMMSRTAGQSGLNPALPIAVAVTVLPIVLVIACVALFLSMMLRLSRALGEAIRNQAAMQPA